MSSMSAMAFNTVSMSKFQIKNRLFLEQSMNIYKEIQKLNLQTVKEKEDEYLLRVNMLPKCLIHSLIDVQTTTNQTEQNDTDNRVRITFFNDNFRRRKNTSSGASSGASSGTSSGASSVSSTSTSYSSSVFDSV